MTEATAQQRQDGRDSSNERTASQGGGRQLQRRSQWRLEGERMAMRWGRNSSEKIGRERQDADDGGQ
jgi:hypothetical protein